MRRVQSAPANLAALQHRTRTSSTISTIAPIHVAPQCETEDGEPREHHLATHLRAVVRTDVSADMAKLASDDVRDIVAEILALAIEPDRFRARLKDAVRDVAVRLLVSTIAHHVVRDVTHRLFVQ